MTAHELWLDILLFLMLWIPAKLIGLIVDSFLQIPVEPKPQRVWQSSDEILEHFFNSRKNIFYDVSTNACVKRVVLQNIKLEEIQELSKFFFKNGTQPFKFNMLNEIWRMENEAQRECEKIERIQREQQIAYAYKLKREGKK